MADRIRPQPDATSEIVTIDGKRVRRTTTIVDVTDAELQSQLAALTEQIASTIARYVTPLENRKAEIQAKIDELK